MTLEEKQKYAKEELGITQAYNMKEETLDKKIAEAEAPKEIKLGPTTIAALEFAGADEKFMLEIMEDEGWDNVRWNNITQTFVGYIDGEAKGQVPIHSIYEAIKQAEIKQ